MTLECNELWCIFLMLVYLYVIEDGADDGADDFEDYAMVKRPHFGLVCKNFGHGYFPLNQAELQVQRPFMVWGRHVYHHDVRGPPSQKGCLEPSSSETVRSFSSSLLGRWLVGALRPLSLRWT